MKKDDIHFLVLQGCSTTPMGCVPMGIENQLVKDVALRVNTWATIPTLLFLQQPKFVYRIGVIGVGHNFFPFFWRVSIASNFLTSYSFNLKYCNYFHKNFISTKCKMVESPPCSNFHACRDCLTTSKI